MNTSNTTLGNHATTWRNVETAAYAVLALVLIGPLFMTNGPLSAAQIFSVLAGAWFGTIAGCRFTPLSAALDRAKQVEKVAPINLAKLATILPFNLVRPQNTAQEACGDQKRAA